MDHIAPRCWLWVPQRLLLSSRRSCSSRPGIWPSLNSLVSRDYLTGLGNPSLFIAIAVGIIVLQTAFIAGLALSRSRRRRTELSFRENEEAMALAASSANIGLWSWDIGYDKVRATPHCKVILGLTGKEPCNLRTFLNCVHPDDRTMLREAIEKGIEFPAEVRCRAPHHLAQRRTSLDRRQRPRQVRPQPASRGSDGRLCRYHAPQGGRGRSRPAADLCHASDPRRHAGRVVGRGGS